MEASTGSKGGGSMFRVQQCLVMKDITKGPILEAKVHNAFLKEIGSGLECTLRNCDGKLLIICWKTRLRFREIIRGQRTRWITTP